MKGQNKMENSNGTITINGIDYVRADDNIAVSDTQHVIIIAQRGWIFEGKKDMVTAPSEITLLNANVVRSWSNGRGIGGLCQKDYKDEYTLDPVGQVTFPREGIIAEIAITEW
jgi:hypothetical protein